MANKDKRAKRAKLKAKNNRISKARVVSPPQFNSEFKGIELKTLTSEIISEGVPIFDREIADYIQQFEAEDYAGNEMNIAIKNESGDIYRTINTYGMKPFMDIIFYLQEIGLRDIYQDVTTNNSGYDAVFAIDKVALDERKNTAISDHLLAQLTAWVEYMDGEPPIDNNDDFCALKKNRPSWTFDMCAVYWKFAYELTDSSFSETPNDNVKMIVKNATEKAFQNSSYLNT